MKTSSFENNVFYIIVFWYVILHTESIDNLVQSRLGFLLPLEDGVRDGTFSSTRLVGGHEEFLGKITRM